jgi:hypothetical protein
MKSFGIIAITIVFLMGDYLVINAQSDDSGIRQIELMNSSLGMWKTIVSNDTIEFWDQQHYGQGYIAYAYLEVQGKRIPQHINIYAFDRKIGKFKGYILWHENGFATWTGSFVEDKKFHVEFTTDYNPEKVWGSFDMIFTDSTSRNHLHFVNNKKTHEEVFTIVK